MPALTREEICRLIPHREPFLWLDEVVDVDERHIHARKFVSPELDLFRGHYPSQPILPGVILCEAAMQAGAVLIARLPGAALTPGQVPVATRINNVKFRQVVRPGDTLEIEADLTEQLGAAFFLTGKIRVGSKVAVQLEFACAAAPVLEA